MILLPNGMAHQRMELNERQIKVLVALEPLLREKFPDMVGKSSQEWAAFLNEYTGLAVAHETPNSTAFDVWRTGVEIREARRLRLFPRNVDACHRWQKPCTFFDVCSGAASLSDPTRFRRTDNPHEELQQVTARAADVAA